MLINSREYINFLNQTKKFQQNVFGLAMEMKCIFPINRKQSINGWYFQITLLCCVICICSFLVYEVDFIYLFTVWYCGSNRSRKVFLDTCIIPDYWSSWWQDYHRWCSHSQAGFAWFEKQTHYYPPSELFSDLILIIC